MLGEALGVPPERILPFSREPLGRGTVAGFHVVDHDRDGEPLLYYLDTSRLPVVRETGLASDGSTTPEARVWLHPADPHLPALPAVAFAHAASSLLARAGLAASGEPEIVGYRPGRRAVLRIATDAGRVWVKVVRPSRSARIARAHEACRRAGLPVPEVPAWSPEGVLLIADAAGRPAADVAWDPDDLLRQVDALRARIDAVDVHDAARGVAGRLDWYASRLSGSPRAQRVADGARRLLMSAGDRPQRIVHGDLHFGQLFLDEEHRVRGLVDVDTLGRGDAAEDAAAFLAHATASALISPDLVRDRVWRLADAAVERWGGDPAARALGAVHLLGHALGAADRGAHAGAEDLLRAAGAVVEGRAPSSAAGEGDGV
ncbi:hypothetical protein AOA12_13545 [Microbacterium sp. No. 7]|nr:hypothetical protein AOA12_13545 [Microbacterium sp. No. 7]